MLAVLDKVMCLNPQSVENYPNVNLPKVDNITSPFKWVEVSRILEGDSVDFEDGFNDYNLDCKRDEECYSELVEDIVENGYLDPVFWDDNTLGNGHHRLAASIDLGYTHIPTTNDSDIEWQESGRVSWR